MNPSPQCQDGELSPTIRCPEPAEYTYTLTHPMSAFEARPYLSCARHRMYDGKGKIVGTRLNMEP
jgi:hypothetical protein